MDFINCCLLPRLLLDLFQGNVFLNQRSNSAISRAIFSEYFPMSYQIFAEKGFRLVAEIFLRSKHKHYVKDTTHGQIRLTDEYPT